MPHDDREKTCADCKCRDCDPITAMAERMDAWRSAESLLMGRDWGDDYTVQPIDVMALADWLLYGPSASDDGDGDK